MSKRYTLGEPLYISSTGDHALYQILDRGATVSGWGATATPVVINNISDECEITGGDFYGGEFNGGNFFGGRYIGGVFHGGWFHRGRFEGGAYYGGIFYGGTYIAGVFHCGYYTNDITHIEYYTAVFDKVDNSIPVNIYQNSENGPLEIYPV